MKDKSFVNRDFSPSKNPRVDNIKAAAENLVEIINEYAQDGPLKDKAILDAQSASMFAVKSLFS